MRSSILAVVSVAACVNATAIDGPGFDDGEACEPGSACTGGGTCVQYTPSNGVSKTICAAGPADMRCNEAPFFCDGETVVTCRDGYPVKRFDCATLGRFCDPVRSCVLREDPRCDPRRPTTQLCDGDHLVKCLRGDRVAEDCEIDAGFVCREGEAGFSCLYRGTL